MKKHVLVWSPLFLTVASCGSGSEDQPSSTGNLVAEAFCDVKGLEKPVRQTFVLLDSSVVARTSTAEEFVASNAWLRDAILDIADPAKGIDSGASVPRERITIINLPKDGSAGSRIFTGCIPAMTTAEIANINSNRSLLSDSFGGGVRDKIKTEVEYFRVRLVAALIAAARIGDAGHASVSGPISQRSLFASLKSSKGLLDAGQDVPRLVLVSDFSHAEDISTASSADVRRAGFVAGQQFGLHLGGSDIVIVQRDASDPMKRAFLESFFLSQQGRVIYNGGNKVSGLPAPPTSIRRYSAQAFYPDGDANVQVRIGIDRTGKLASSWMTLSDQFDRALPMLGQADCDSVGTCMLRSTSDDFGQSWSLSPGGEPEFATEMPFGGMRNFEIRIEGQKFEGRVFDPLIYQVGPVAGTRSIRLTGTLRRDGTF
jgi:hypothetical protein